ncbi:MAG: DUF3329 domain-containing protein [Pseudomonadota bacterium]
MLKLFDFNHPFFEPLWRRIAVVVFCIGWGVFEFISGATFWGVLFGGLGLFAGYAFFIAPQEPNVSDD